MSNDIQAVYRSLGVKCILSVDWGSKSSHHQRNPVSFQTIRCRSQPQASLPHCRLSDVSRSCQGNEQNMDAGPRQSIFEDVVWNVSRFPNDGCLPPRGGYVQDTEQPNSVRAASNPRNRRLRPVHGYEIWELIYYFTYWRGKEKSKWKLLIEGGDHHVEVICVVFPQVSPGRPHKILNYEKPHP